MNFLEKLLDGVEVEWKPLGEVCRFINGKAYKQQELLEAGKYPVLRVGNFFTNGNWYYSDLELEEDKYCDKGDLLYAWSASFGPKIWDGEKVIYHYHIWKVVPDASMISKKYLFYLLAWDTEALKAESGTGSTMMHVGKGAIEKRLVPIPCPDNPEKSLAIQAEIVRILDTFTALTAELTAELTDRKKQYNYYRDRLLTFEKGEAEWKTLGEVAKTYDGTHQTPKYSSSGVPFVSVENIRNPYKTKKFISVDDFEKYKYKPQKDDLFMTRIGDIGTCAVVENDEPLAYYVTLTLIRVDKNSILPKFLKYVIESHIGKSELYKRTLVNAAPIKINLGEIGKIIIPVPLLAEQTRIVTILDKFDAIATSIREGLPREIALRQKQYEYYRDLLLTFPKSEEVEA